MLSNHNSRDRVAVSSDVLAIVSRMAVPVDEHELLGEVAVSQRPAVRALLGRLVEHGLLHHGDDTGRCGESGPLSTFGPDAESFHHAAMDVGFVPFRSERSAALAAGFSREEQPNRIKTYPDAPRVYLSRHNRPLRAEIDDVFAARRTHRDFLARPVLLDDLATVLNRSSGVTRFQDTGPLGTQLVKVSPAGGSRHDVEAYVLPFNVQGLVPAIYHYHVLEHSLERIADMPSRSDLLDMVGQQPHVVNSAFSVFTTSVISRIAYKYRHARAYRIWMYNVGHVGQTFALAATALQLGPFQTAGFEDTRVAEMLGLDIRDEFPTYMLGAGYPVLRDDGLPEDFRLAEEVGRIT
ncbi:SagB/ThcOx family dehydrogenase [Clavibacter nebraskensis]|uniref:Nitroreductase domain-containing protein n=2 Tax=Clavibacter nebraskensis TaxID=31963 RepID=A0AAI9EJI7_9MICO|nr:SagB/ThcOx family dehydrogenase [Clavibacter nebraskensis]QGV65848.1 SagB/ThcOx family dehydrogenase [Clavibacter nebraskensis]QGV68643.1 SagB/ThcOx family dehydrogenase [Clavibacter nebraskensis]QGV71434.1 SagB/ThcOx family dehydrogenase [Clavibacter nebraskensis]UKF27987.1 SagB/ThcOx family dehydrogenase [Clavibacter nebraskensis]UQB05502.1 SagB/ThcOx family dehydrogenase [Clavibacter nebraskensis]